MILTEFRHFYGDFYGNLWILWNLSNRFNNFSTNFRDSLEMLRPRNEESRRIIEHLVKALCFVNDLIGCIPALVQLPTASYHRSLGLLVSCQLRDPLLFNCNIVQMRCDLINLGSLINLITPKIPHRFGGHFGHLDY